MLDEPPPLDALLPQAARIVLTEPAATPVSAVRRRNARRSKPGLPVSKPSSWSMAPKASWTWSVSDIPSSYPPGLQICAHAMRRRLYLPAYRSPSQYPREMTAEDASPEPPGRGTSDAAG